MLRQLSARSPWILRVFLTASSALAAVLFASAFSFPHPLSYSSLTRPWAASPLRHCPLVTPAP